MFELFSAHSVSSMFPVGRDVERLSLVSWYTPCSSFVLNQYLLRFVLIVRAVSRMHDILQAV